MKNNTNFQAWLRKYGIILIFFVVVLILAAISPTFRLPKNLLNVIKQASVNGILAFGMALVIISGGIDLSVGSIVGLAGVGAALFGSQDSQFIVSIAVALALGSLVGLLNGVGVAYGELPPFIVTLGTMSIGRGLALVFSGGSPVIGISERLKKVASGELLSIPNLSYFLISICAIMGFVLVKTVFGRRIYAIGGNEIAALVSGINVKQYKVVIYTLCGLHAGLAGFLMASRTNQGAPTMGVGYELDAITATVIGGVSMTGGVGKWYGILIGALFIAVIENGLTIFGVDPNWKQVVKGIIIIGAVLLDVKTKGKRN